MFGYVLLGCENWFLYFYQDIETHWFLNQVKIVMGLRLMLDGSGIDLVALISDWLGPSFFVMYNVFKTDHRRRRIAPASR